MEHFLKVADWKWVPGSQKEMLYKDSLGDWFIGPTHSVVIGETYVVEISDGILVDGYRYIKFKERKPTKIR